MRILRTPRIWNSIRDAEKRNGYPASSYLLSARPYTEKACQKMRELQNKNKYLLRDPVSMKLIETNCLCMQCRFNSKQLNDGTFLCKAFHTSAFHYYDCFFFQPKQNNSKQNKG